jgi:hypothetical protein
MHGYCSTDYGEYWPTVMRWATSYLSCGLVVRYSVLTPRAPSLLRTYHSSWDGVLCFLALFLFLSTLATLDSFSLFLCPNPALSFTAVSVCLIYNNVSALVSLDQALLGVFLSVLWQLQSNFLIFLYCLFFSSQWLLDSQCSNLVALSLSGVYILYLWVDFYCPFYSWW